MSFMDASKNLDVKHQQLYDLKEELQNVERVGKSLMISTINCIEIRSSFVEIVALVSSLTSDLEL